MRVSETDGTNGPLVDDGTADLLRQQETWASPPEALESDVLAALRHERDHPESRSSSRSKGSVRHLRAATTRAG